MQLRHILKITMNQKKYGSFFRSKIGAELPGVVAEPLMTPVLTPLVSEYKIQVINDNEAGMHTK